MSAEFRRILRPLPLALPIFFFFLRLHIFREAFTQEFTKASRARMPLPPSELSAMADAAISRAKARLQAVPSAGDGDDSIEDALSALGDFAELAASKVRRSLADVFGVIYMYETIVCLVGQRLFQRKSC